MIYYVMYVLDLFPDLRMFHQHDHCSQYLWVIVNYLDLTLFESRYGCDMLTHLVGHTVNIIFFFLNMNERENDIVYKILFNINERASDIVPGL